MCADQSDPMDGTTPDKNQPPEDALRKLQVAQVYLLATVAVLACLVLVHVAQPILIPITAAVLLSFLFEPLVRRLRTWHVYRWISAVIIVVGVFVLLILAATLVVQPIADWIEHAPERLGKLEERLSGLSKPAEQVSEAAQSLGKLTQVGEEDALLVRMKPAGFARAVFSQTAAVLASFVIMLVLLFFMLASGQMFLRKLLMLLPRFDEKREAVVAFRELEAEVSRYLVVRTVINIGLGLAVWAIFVSVGFPNAKLWALAAALLNYIAYFGPFLFFVLSGVAGLIHFPSVSQALAGPGLFLIINTVEAYVVSPLAFGNRLRLNPIVVFLGIVFWGWMWGVSGALMAVPMLVCLRIAGDHIPVLRPLGVFLAAD